MMDPIVETIVSQVDAVELERVDIHEDPKRSAAHGITAVPTFILINEDGFEVSRKIGLVPAPTFKEWIKGHVA